MGNIAGWYVAEWSPTQKCFHTHTVGDMLKFNRHIFIDGTHTDFIPIAICQTEESLNDFLEEAIRFKGS